MDTPEEIKRRFVALVNCGPPTTRIAAGSDAGPDYAFLRCLGHRVAEVMARHERTWAVTQVIDSEAPEATEMLQRAMAGLLDTRRDGRAADPRPEANDVSGALLPGIPRGVSPFDPDNDIGYRAWREEKLARYPADASALTVEIRDPRALTAAERAALVARSAAPTWSCTPAASHAADPELPRALGRQLGLARLDRNFLADDDGVSRVTVAGEKARGEFIPYTNRPIGWHTDGYYNPPERRIRAMLLHCVRRARRQAARTRCSTTRSPICGCATRIPRMCAR